LGKTSREKQYTRYLELRKEYISTPSFYFDMACFFYQQNDSAAGLRILSNLAELDLENHELYKLLGFKLRETGNYKEAVYVYKKIVEWRPQEPQSYRDYGLALEDAGYFQQALDTLYMAIHKQYDGTLMNNYNGIEETIVTEINQLVALHGSKLDLSGIDKKLIHAMPVDIRVVLSWNIADTDIDLWVTDPNDEKCYYSHKNTAIGGHISNDFTNGYGPEQFLLKKAIKGTYKIEVDFYGERQVRLAGPATVMAEVFTHYSDGKQERKIITVQLEKSERSNLLLGTFSFEK
jgi:tetratricopeptide (TPR) repeat protein